MELDDGLKDAHSAETKSCTQFPVSLRGMNCFYRIACRSDTLFRDDNRTNFLFIKLKLSSKAFGEHKSEHSVLQLLSNHYICKQIVGTWNFQWFLLLHKWLRIEIMNGTQYSNYLICWMGNDSKLNGENCCTKKRIAVLEMIWNAIMETTCQMMHSKNIVQHDICISFSAKFV